MKIVHSNISHEQTQVKRRIPLYKDRAAIEAMANRVILENNERLLKQQNQK